MNELITIIVPVYKVEQYIEKCVSSILAQTYPNLEIILVDDGSPDRCPQICDAFSEKDARIKVIHSTNGGVSRARNLALDIASGSFIGFVDSDDWVEPQMFEALYRTAIETDSQISIVSYTLDHAHSAPESHAGDFDFSAKDIEVVDPESALKSMCLGTKFEGHMWNKLIRRELFDNVRFPESITICEDMMVSTQLMAQANKIAYYPFTGYHYLQREESALHRSPTESDWSVQSACTHMRNIVERNFVNILPYFYYVSMGQDLILAMRLNHAGLLNRACIQRLKKSIINRKYKESFRLLPKGSKIRLNAFLVGKPLFTFVNWLLRNLK